MCKRWGLVVAIALGIAGCAGAQSESSESQAASPTAPAREVAPPESEPAAIEPSVLPGAERGPVTAAELEQAQQCAGERDNACVIQILEGRAQSVLERALLIDAYFASLQMDATSREMRQFLDLYPDDSRAPVYRQHLSIFSE
jgi:Flp pilus assembly protein TadD